MYLYLWSIMPLFTHSLTTTKTTNSDFIMSEDAREAALLHCSTLSVLLVLSPDFAD